MKRFILFLTFFFALFLVSVPLMAQDATGGTIPDFTNLFATYAGFCAGIVVLTGLLTKIISLNRLGRSIASWVISLLVALLGWWLKLGIFSGIDIVGVLGIVISCGLGANVIYNISWFRDLLANLKIAEQKSTKK